MFHSTKRTFHSTKHTFQSMKYTFHSMKYKIPQGERSFSLRGSNIFHEGKPYFSLRVATFFIPCGRISHEG